MQHDVLKTTKTYRNLLSLKTIWKNEKLHISSYRKNISSNQVVKYQILNSKLLISRNFCQKVSIINSLKKYFVKRLYFVKISWKQCSKILWIDFTKFLQKIACMMNNISQFQNALLCIQNQNLSDWWVTCIVLKWFHEKITNIV